MLQPLVGPRRARIDHAHGGETIGLGPCALGYVAIVFAAEYRLDENRSVDLVFEHRLAGQFDWHVGLRRNNGVDAWRFAAGRSPHVQMGIDDCQEFAPTSSRTRSC